MDGGLYLLAAARLDREAYRVLLRGVLQREVQVDSGFEPRAVRSALLRRPALAILLARTPTPHVQAAFGLFHGQATQMPVLLIVEQLSPRIPAPWARLEPDGFLRRCATAGELGRALQVLEGGGRYFEAAARSGAGDPGAPGPGALSERERELLPLLAIGRSLQEAADEMGIGYKTADTYRSKLFRKLGVRNRVELSRYAIRRRLIEA